MMLGILKERGNVPKRGHIRASNYEGAAGRQKLNTAPGLLQEVRTPIAGGKELKPLHREADMDVGVPAQNRRRGNQFQSGDSWSGERRAGSV